MSVVDEVKQKLDIVDLVSETVKLRRSGRTFSGFCPFHQNTRTPAFYVFPETQTWHCFGACGTGGDIFTFLMKRDHVDFGEALRVLAARAGVVLVRDGGEGGETKRLIEINEAAAAFYHYQLKHNPAAQAARDYIKRRRISEESVQAFQIGFAPPSLNALIEHLKLKNFTIVEMERAGVAQSLEGGMVRDRFRGRLMFPIRNRRGETVAFGARALAEDQQPKYLNSPDSPIFSKSDTLYGLDLAKQAIRAENLAVIVEGYTDVVIAHQEGFKNVVASLGTALTEKQLSQLSRLTKRFALALDADTAGAAATERGLALARQALSHKNSPVPVGAGLVVFKERLDAELLVIEMPAGRDPDEIILEDHEAWRGLVDGALPLLDHYFRVQARGIDLESAQGKSEFARRLLPVIAEVKDQVQRTHYAQRLARIIQTDERIILDQLRVEETVQAPIRVDRPARVLPERPAPARYDEYLITLTLSAPELWTHAGFVEDDDFERGDTREIWQALKRYASVAVVFEMEDLMDMLSTAARETGERLRNAAKHIQFNPAELAREIEAAGYRLRLQRYQTELNQLRFLLDESTGEDRVELTRRVSQVSMWLAETRRAVDARSVLKHPKPSRT